MKAKSDLLSFAIQLAKSAGEIHMQYFGKLLSVDRKSSKIDLVSKADLESNKYIIDKISLDNDSLDRWRS